jgi:hypothetical protein
MTVQELAVWWLGDRAEGLRAAALRADSAYRRSPEMVAMCKRVAEAYRQAAAVLEGAAAKEMGRTEKKEPAP